MDEVSADWLRRQITQIEVRLAVALDQVDQHAADARRWSSQSTCLHLAYAACEVTYLSARLETLREALEALT